MEEMHFFDDFQYHFLKTEFKNVLEVKKLLNASFFCIFESLEMTFYAFIMNVYKNNL